MRAGWEIKKLGEVVEVLDKLRRPITKRDRIEGDYPYYGATGILSYVQGYIFTEKLVLIGEDGAKWDSGDKTSFIAEGKYWVNNHAHVVRPIRKIILDEWIVYFLNFSDLTPFITGMTVPKLNQEKMRGIPIPLPPLPEQQRIVTILDEAFAAIAKAKANAEQNLKNAKELFESYLQGVFEKKGEGWEDTQLCKLCLPNRIITYGVIKLGDDIEDGVPCLRTSNVRWLSIDVTGMKRILPELSKDYSRTILEGGEVLVNVRGTLGGVAVVPKTMKGWNVSREVAVVPIDSNKIDPFFISSFIGSKTAQNWLGGVKKGAAYVGINIEDLRLLPIPLPNLKEQKTIVRQLDALRAETQRLEAVYGQKLADLEELKKSILQKAFAGELKTEVEVNL